MSDFLDYSVIKRKIESEVCIEHNVRPQFIKTTKGFQINCCCEEFKKKLLEKAQKYVAEQTKLAVDKMLKKAFKR
jgi:hypothetical protein